MLRYNEWSDKPVRPVRGFLCLPNGSLCFIIKGFFACTFAKVMLFISIDPSKVNT